MPGVCRHASNSMHAVFACCCCNLCCFSADVAQYNQDLAGPNNRYGRSKTGCPRCAGQASCKCNSLQALYPDIAAEWDYAKNEGQPSDCTASSHHLFWWFSSKRGSWQQAIYSCSEGLRSKPARLKRIQQRQKTVAQF